MRDNPFTTKGWTAIGMPLAVLVASAIAGFLGLYVIVGPNDNVGRKDAVPTTKASTPAPAVPGKLNSGEMTAFVFRKAPEELSEIAFKGRAGEELTLKNWQGRVVLLNLWATWCAPCRKEMPALDRLQKDLGSKDFEVVALAVDRAGPEAAARFLAQVDVKSLGLYVDASARAGTALKAIGLPTTILIDRQGREVGRLTGPAEWDSADAKRLIEATLR